MSNINQENTYRDDDILFVAFCITKGVSLVEISEDTPNHFVFHLSDPETCEQLKHPYLNNAEAPARLLFSNREMLISEIKNRRGGEKYGR